MIFLRKILFPLAILYGWITQFRNFLYDKGILKSYAFDIPVIAVGNLSVGGTGKTPQIEYLVRLLSTDNMVATLSRGYKRKSKGFILANEISTAASLGDEPYQMHLKFPNIQVAVDADRKNGIEQLLSKENKPEIIVLDDAFQHRRVRAGFYILLTTFEELYVDDCLLPTGNLRESKSGAHRADVIIVTKCPPTISESEMQVVKDKLNIDKPIFFSTISYDDSVYSLESSLKVHELQSIPKLLIAGIAKPKPFFAYLQNEGDEIMEFPDHHHFSESDIDTIRKSAGNKRVITTEKDFVRLKEHLPSSQLFYLPIKTKLVADGDQLDQIILNYVGTSTRNS
ncbi:MAG: tetraacyldisaccharide 4'-kinase [Flavobacterium sp.]|nr:tetraacyldisaccharide 4'-kinase [Flavobacterium sp.]